MRTFLLKRLLHTVPLLFGVTLLTFLIIHLSPGDYISMQMENPQMRPEAIERMRHNFGLDQPWYLQYLKYVGRIVLHGDFGESFSRHQPVFAVIRQGLFNTLLLAGAAAVFTWALAIPLGIVAAVRQHTWTDRSAGFLAFLGLSVPEVLFALVAVFLAAKTRLLPIAGMHSIDYDDMSLPGKAWDLARHLLLPAVVLGSSAMAGRMRQMRGNLLEVLRADYVTTARAKGLPERQVIWRHAVRNAINPLITLFGYTLGSLLAGSFVVEIIADWPGLGRLTLEAFTTRDMYLVMGSLIMGTVMLVLGNLVSDVLLALADPRISYD
jgi:peptide/nickel transport system permease protein